MAPASEPLTTSILAIMYFGDVVFAVSGALTAAQPDELVEAVRFDDRSSVAALLNAGADPDARDPDGATALSWAVVRGNVGTATLLLEAGADPEPTNELGIGPLGLAVENGSAGMVRLLLEHGASPGPPRQSGETPLMTAASRDFDPPQLPEEILEGIYLVELTGSLFFGNSGSMQRKLEGLTEATAVVIDMKDVPYIDQSGAYAFADLMERLVEHETEIYIAGLQPKPAELMHRLEFIPGLCPDERIFESIKGAVRQASVDAHDAATNNGSGLRA